MKQMDVNETYEKYRLSAQGSLEQHEHAYENLWLALHQYIRAIIASLYGNRYYYMEDAIGETACKILQHVSDFEADKREGKGNFAKWVYVLTRNACADIARTRFRNREEKLVDKGRFVNEPKYIDLLALDSLIAKLSTEDQRLIEMKLNGTTSEDIAEQFATTSDAIKARWRRVQEELRTLGGGY